MFPNFYPRPPRGGRHVSVVDLDETAEFLSTPSARRATLVQAPQEADHEYFYPRPPRGGRRRCFEGSAEPVQFLSTPSARRATLRWRLNEIYRAISIHALREEGDPVQSSPTVRWWGFLSTPSARRATHQLHNLLVVKIISIHALREEGDLISTSGPVPTTLFLSTPSARRATSVTDFVTEPYWISIHALREEGDVSYGRTNIEDAISIHALREEGDLIRTSRIRRTEYFYPRPPRGGRQEIRPVKQAGRKISIHALREEGDAGHRGGRRRVGISIHALREEGDDELAFELQEAENFYPRPPRGGRPRTRSSSWSITNFYPRPPRGGRRISTGTTPRTA